MSLTITIPGAVNVTTGSFAPAVLTIGVGVPGAQGPQGPAGQGVPVGGTAGQFLTKIDGTNYNTDWTTVNLSVYAVKANNLSDLTSVSTARSNLGLGTMATASAADYSTTTVANALYYPLSGNPSSFLTASALTGYATQSFVAANYAPIAAGLPPGGTVGQVLTKNSGTDYDDSWQTLIPGDRYLTTSTTSNSVSNGTKTFTVGTGLSYSSQQDVVISYDAANHMHAVVTSYNSGTGALVVDVKSHTGSGTYASWTVNVGGTTPLQTVEWGEILGVLGDQADLATALNAKLESSTAASTYAALAGATFTGEVITPASTTSSAGLMITPGVAPTAPVNGEIWATTNDIQVRLNGVTETLAEQSWVTAGFYPLSGNPSGFLTSSALTPYAPLAGATFTGLVNTPAATTTTAGFRLPHGTAPTTPTDGDVWTTTGNLWVRINGVSQAIALQGSSAQLSSNNIFTNASSTYGNSTAAGTINLGTGATISGATRTINIGTASAAGSTNNINIGGGSGTITTTVAGTLTATGTTLNLGNSTAASTINLGTGATISGSTKTVNVATGGVAGSTTSITVGSTTGTSTTTLQGTTNGVTVAADTNSTALATTAYVVGQAGSATPLVDGTAAVGTSLRYARQDHVHPTDTTRAALASPTFTGTPAAPTAAVDTNTTQIATTAFVVGQGYAKLASPTFTGTPSLPTGTTAVTQTAGNNTTAVATTAFVQAALPAVSTTAQVLDLTSNTVTVSPLALSKALMHPSYRKYTSYAGNSVGTTSGTGSSNYAHSHWIENLGPSSGATGSAMMTPANVTGFDMIGRDGEANINFSKRVLFSGKFGLAASSGFNGDASNYWLCTVGKSSVYAGDLTGRGIGIRKYGATANFFLVVHNGTTLTAIDSGVSNNSFTTNTDFLIYSDGAGNVTMWLNDVQVATTALGPTGTATSGARIYSEVNQVGTFGARLGTHTSNFALFISP